MLVIYQFPARKSIAAPPRGPPWGSGHLDTCSAKAAVGLPLPSHRCHLYCDDCLGHGREDCWSCSVLYCVPRLYTVVGTQIWTVLTDVLCYFRFIHFVLGFLCVFIVR